MSAITHEDKSGTLPAYGQNVNSTGMALFKSVWTLISNEEDTHIGCIQYLYLYLKMLRYQI